MELHIFTGVAIAMQGRWARLVQGRCQVRGRLKGNGKVPADYDRGGGCEFWLRLGPCDFLPSCLGVS